jgi:hypothetical protein
VEMWFERSLMEYDRVFASMAIPACCWRRTGEIFRGNREMAELIHVPIESFRDVSAKYAQNQDAFVKAHTRENWPSMRLSWKISSSVTGRNLVLSRLIVCRRQC